MKGIALLNLYLAVLENGALSASPHRHYLSIISYLWERCRLFIRLGSNPLSEDLKFA